MEHRIDNDPEAAAYRRRRFGIFQAAVAAGASPDQAEAVTAAALKAWDEAAPVARLRRDLRQVAANG